MDDETKYRFDNLDSKIEDLIDLSKDQTKKLHSHDIKFVKYNALLERHIEGVEQNRAGVKEVKEELDDHKTESHKDHMALKEELEPLINKKKAWKLLLGIVMGAGGIIALSLSIMGRLGKL